MKDYTKAIQFVADVNDDDANISNPEMVAGVKEVFDSGYIDVLEATDPNEFFAYTMMRTFMVTMGETL